MTVENKVLDLTFPAPQGGWGKVTAFSIGGVGTFVLNEETGEFDPI